MEIVKPKTAAQLHARLSPTDKANILRATPAGLEYLRQCMLSDGPPSVEALQEVKARLEAEY